MKGDEREYMKMLGLETEEAAHQGNLRGLYATIKKLFGKFGKLERPVKDKGESFFQTKKDRRRDGWSNFEELLKRPAPQDLPDIPPANNDLPVDCDPPTKKTIYQVIKQLENCKSAGPDSIPAGALKMDIETCVELLYPLPKKIC